MWDAATVKIGLGGVADIDDLEDISRLAGEYDHHHHPQQLDDEWVTLHQPPAARVLPVEELGTLPFGWAALLLHGTPGPVRLQMTPWWKCPDARQVTEAIAAAESEQSAQTAVG